MYLASLGYAALGVGYFGAEGLPPALESVPLEILERDLAWLSGHARVAPGGVVVVGGSRGGELALMLGARFPIVKGVVAQVPSGYVWPGTTGETAAWTWGGEPLPFVPPSEAFAELAVSSEGLRGYASTPMFLDAIALAPPEALELATIPAERIDGPVLLLGASDDQVWPSCELAEVAFARLAGEHATTHGDRFLCHPDAGHLSVGTPGWTSVGSTAVDYPALGAKLVTGGTVAGNGAAVRANDTATRAFLEAVLGAGAIIAPSSRP
jgi:pimeloyl-ACP methyl ester carboxylesterase